MTSEPQTRIDTGSSRVAASEISALLQEAADLAAERGASPSRRVAFHLLNAEFFERLAADEPDNADRPAAAMQARRQYEHHMVLAELVTG